MLGETVVGAEIAEDGADDGDIGRFGTRSNGRRH